MSSSKLSELWEFLYTKVTWNINFNKFWNLEISVNFRDRSPNFCMWSLNLYLNNMSIATWGLSPLHHWFLRGGFRSPPPSDPENLYPLRGRVKDIDVHIYKSMIVAAFLWSKIPSKKFFWGMFLSSFDSSLVLANIWQKTTPPLQTHWAFVEDVWLNSCAG